MSKFNASNTKQVADEAELIAYDVTPTSNDEIQLANGSSYAWIEGSTATADGIIIIDQTIATTLGRWHKRITAKNVLTFAITLEDLESGELSQKNDYTATGLLTTNFNLISYEAPATSGLIINSVAQSGNGLIGVNYENQSGALLTGEVINVKVLVI